MLPNVYGPYTRKEITTGVPGRPDLGAPSWDDELATAFPGRAFQTFADGTEVEVRFDDPPLTQTEIDGPLQDAYDAWVPWDPAEHKARKISDLDQDAQAAIHGVLYAAGLRLDPVRYNLSVLALLTQAHTRAQGTRQLHAAQLLDWYVGIFGQLLTASAAVQAAATPEAVDAVSIDWDAWLAANPWPGVTVATVLAQPATANAADQAEDLDPQPTQSDSFVEALTATIPDLGATAVPPIVGSQVTWRVTWTATIWTDAGVNRGCEARVQLDDTTVWQTAGSRPAILDVVVLTWAEDRRTLSGEILLTVTGTARVDIDFRRSGSAGTAWIENCRITWERVG